VQRTQARLQPDTAPFVASAITHRASFSLFLLAVSVLLGLLIFKLVDPHPRCFSPLWQEQYGADRPAFCRHDRGCGIFPQVNSAGEIDDPGASINRLILRPCGSFALRRNDIDHPHRRRFD